MKGSLQLAAHRLLGERPAYSGAFSIDFIKRGVADWMRGRPVTEPTVVSTKRTVFPTFAESEDFLNASGYARLGDSWVADDGSGSTANVFSAEDGRRFGSSPLFIVEIRRRP